MEKSYYSVIDSGTTLTYFPSKIYNDFENYFKDYCNKNECKGNLKGICLTPKSGYSWDDFYTSLPEIFFFLKDQSNDYVKVIWKPIDYLIVSETNKSDLCVGITKWR